HVPQRARDARARIPEGPAARVSAVLRARNRWSVHRLSGHGRQGAGHPARHTIRMTMTGAPYRAWPLDPELRTLCDLPRARRDVLVRLLRFGHARVDALAVDRTLVHARQNRGGAEQREDDEELPVRNVRPAGASAIRFEELGLGRNAEILQVVIREAAPARAR